MLTFTVPGTPVAQPRPRSGRYNQRYYDDTHPIHGYKLDILNAFKQSDYDGPIIIDRPVSLGVRFTFERRQVNLKKRSPMVELPHTTKPDLDNLIKAVKDALSGHLWIDDKLVCEYHFAKKVWGAATYWPEDDMFNLQPACTLIDVRFVE